MIDRGTDDVERAFTLLVRIINARTLGALRDTHS